MPRAAATSLCLTTHLFAPLAPQVVRKIRAEQFSDASGNLKLWCQFFNVLSDSKLTWYKDEIPVAEAQRR